MKKIVLIVTTIICTLVLSACVNNANIKENDKINVVASIFPQYDWARQIIGESDNINLTLLFDKGVDMHSFQPRVEDIAKVSNCDLFIYVGGESDEWVEDALKEAVNPDMRTINLLDVLGEQAKIEERVEGMEESDEEEAEYDEHVWLSLENAKIFSKEIANVLKEMDPENSNIYEGNLNSYLDKLQSLDGEYKDAIKNAKTTTLVFADRFPFRYMVDDYGLSYYAACAGCSTESEVGFDTVVFLSNKIDELGINNIIKIEDSDGKIADTVKKGTINKNQNVLVFNSMQSISAKDIQDGITYLDVMKENLNTLREAIN